MIPVIYSEQLMPGTIEFAIDDIVDNYIDTSVFNIRYRNESIGAKAYPPSVLLKIILFAYSKVVIRHEKFKNFVKGTFKELENKKQKFKTMGLSLFTAANQLMKKH